MTTDPWYLAEKYHRELVNLREDLAMALADPTRRIQQTIFLHLFNDTDSGAGMVTDCPQVDLGNDQATIFIHSRTAALGLAQAVQRAVDFYDQKMQAEGLDPC